MEKFSNQNLKEVISTLKNGKFSITKNSNLIYDKLNIVTGSSEYRTLFLRSLVSSIDSENRNEISILTNINNLKQTKVKTTYIMEKDIDKVVMNICDDIFAVSRFSIHWNNRPNFIYVIDIPDNCYNKERYIEKLNKIINTASQLNVMIILGIIECSGRYKDFCNVLSITNNQIGDSYINGDEFKVEMVSDKYVLYIEDSAEEDSITFETYGYHKVVDDEFRVVYQNDNYSITVDKKVYRYIKENRFTQSSAYIFEQEDILIHELLNNFKRFRILDEDKEAIQNLIDKKKIRLTQETIDKTDKTLENLNINTDRKIFAVYCQDKKTDKKTYVAELQEDRTILFSDKPTGFDLRTCIYLTNELMNHYNIVGKEEIK